MSQEKQVNIVGGGLTPLMSPTSESNTLVNPAPSVTVTSGESVFSQGD